MLLQLLLIPAVSALKSLADASPSSSSLFWPTVPAHSIDRSMAHCSWRLLSFPKSAYADVYERFWFFATMSATDVSGFTVLTPKKLWCTLFWHSHSHTPRVGALCVVILWSVDGVNGIREEASRIGCVKDAGCNRCVKSLIIPEPIFFSDLWMESKKESISDLHPQHPVTDSHSFMSDIVVSVSFRASTLLHSRVHLVGWSRRECVRIRHTHVEGRRFVRFVCLHEIFLSPSFSISINWWKWKNTRLHRTNLLWRSCYACFLPETMMCTLSSVPSFPHFTASLCISPSFGITALNFGSAPDLRQ